MVAMIHLAFLALGISLSASVAQAGDTPMCQTGVTIQGFGTASWDGNYMHFVNGQYNLNTEADVPKLIRYDKKAIAAAHGTDFDPALTDKFIDKWLLMQQTFGSNPYRPYVCGRFIDPDIWPKPAFVPCKVYAVCSKGCPDIPGYNVSTDISGVFKWDPAIWPATGELTTEWQLLNDNSSRPESMATVPASCCKQKPEQCRGCKESDCGSLGYKDCGTGVNKCCKWLKPSFSPPSCVCPQVPNECAPS